MPIRIQQGDVLDASAQALLVTVSPDGIAEIQPGEGTDRILGNVARQFRTRWPSAWDEVERALWEAQEQGELDLLRPGGTYLVDLDDSDCTFGRLEMISTLSHDSDADQRSLARLALRRGLAELLSEGISDIATTLPAGGWRLGLEAAFRELGMAFRGALAVLPQEERRFVNLCLWTKDGDTREKLERLLPSLSL